MSDMKCPFCQQELTEFAGTVDCVNIDCIKTRGWYGNKKLWQELITTRKALDIAIGALKNAAEYLGNQEPLVDVMATNLHIDLSKALDQINEIKGGNDETDNRSN